jgi:hypothetical protein
MSQKGPHGNEHKQLSFKYIKSFPLAFNFNLTLCSKIFVGGLAWVTTKGTSSFSAR